MENAVAKRENNKRLKTWSHRAGIRRRPSEYEITCVDTNFTLTNPERALELDSNEYMNQWYRKYREGTALKHDDWKHWLDPDEMIYRSYTTLQNGQETYVEGLVDHYDELDHDASLNHDWLQTLVVAYTPMRYLLHTLQMCSGYLGLIAPSSTLQIASSFQMADQLRWVSRVSYRAAELRNNRPGFGFGETERDHWEGHPAWQGLRELVEKLLVVYDWGETHVVLNFVALPAISEGVLRPLAQAARRNSDSLLGLLLDSELRDLDRNRRWAASSVKYAIDFEPSNRQVVDGWIEKWEPLADAAIEAYCAELPDVPGAADAAKSASRTVRTSMMV